MTLQINRTILFAVLLTAAASTDCSWAADESGPKKPDEVKDLERVEVSASRVRKEYSKIFFNFGGTPRFRTVSSYGRQIATSREQETDDRKQKCDENAGNPVVLYTGNKVEPELDFAAVSEMGLYLERIYNHHWSATGLFGNHWLSNFDYSLVLSDGNDIAWSQRPDGRRIKFLHDPSTGRWYEDKAQPIAYVEKASDGSFVLHNEERGYETYSADGYVNEIKNEQGVSWLFSYSDNRLRKVTHASGRTVQFGWTNGQLTTVTDPAGNIYTYTYTANVFGTGRGRLAGATLPGSPATTISYHYEDSRYPGGLTGKSLNGSRYSTFEYDAQRRAILTEHAGGVERYQFSYVVHSSEQVVPAPAPVRPGGVLNDEGRGWCDTGPSGKEICYQPRSIEGPVFVGAGDGPTSAQANTAQSTSPATKTRAVRVSTAVTNPLGRVTTTTYDDGKQVSVTGDASPRCAASHKEQTYDVNGYPNLVSDFADNLTHYDYNPKGQMLKRVEAVGKSAERTTQWEWNAENRVAKETVPGNLEMSYTYDSRGNIASITERNLGTYGASGQSRTTYITYTYHANGLKASAKVDGPLAQDDVTQHYDSHGDLTATVNGLGHVISYASYNELGLPGKITGANGEVVEMNYDGQGRMVSQRQRVGSGWATSSTIFDGIGNVVSITRPDGVTTRFSYDAARRLLQEVRPMGDGTYVWTHYSYDSASNLIRTEVRHVDYPIGSTITGAIDGITHDANWNWFARGWACSTGSNSSIKVDAYVEGGTYLGSAQANLASEAAVANACQASGSAYRFQLPITLEHRQQLGGKPLIIYGISPLGSTHNAALPNSNVHAIPPAPVIGNVAGVTQDADWNFAVEGWSCAVGMSHPTSVMVHAGGPPGQGTHIGNMTGAPFSDDDIKAKCEGQGAYWFKLPLDVGVRTAHGSKSLHVTGISPAAHGDAALNSSGMFTIPAVLRQAENVGVSLSPEHISNGESATLITQVKNTGNVVWYGDTYLAWGLGALGSQIALDRAIRPGEVAEFSTRVAPVRQGTGIGRFVYNVQMATNSVLWGPHSSVTLVVENPFGDCDPDKPRCNPPVFIGPPVELGAKEGAR